MSDRPVRSRLLPGARHLLPVSILTAASAALGTAATNQAVDSRWFEQLDKPAFYPPRWAFPVAWTALYTDIALATSAALDAMSEAERRALWRSLVINLGLNSAWCWVFFAKREPALSVPVALALTLSSAGLAHRVGSARRGWGAALMPYPAWCAFATVLSSSIAARNDRG